MSKKILNKPYPMSSQLEIEDAKYIALLAYHKHISVSQMIRNILLEYIHKHKKFMVDNK